MMKKIVSIVLCLTIAITAFANTLVLQSTQFAGAIVNNGYYRWGDWEPSSVQILIDTDENYIYINSDTEQLYKLLQYKQERDNKGNQVVTFKVIDQDGDRGEIRIRKDGNYQIYIDFNNVAWVYSCYQIK